MNEPTFEVFFPSWWSYLDAHYVITKHRGWGLSVWQYFHPCHTMEVWIRR